MNSFKHIFFDFDGTLFDSSQGVFKSFDHVVKHYGLNINPEIYNTMIGPPLCDSFARCFGLAQNEIQNAINVYREYYEQGGLFECRVYDGIPELIKKLRDAGLKTYVATSKPEVYARQIIEKKGMSNLFDFIGGSDIAEKERVNKIDVINYIIKTLHLENEKDSILMIGDRKYDVEGAHKAGLKCMGILWGFGSRDEFNECHADFIEDDPQSVAGFLLQTGINK